MRKLMICGSRHRTPKMSDYAVRCVVRAKENGDSIIVGDAQGIDADVISACIRLDVPYTCYGISPTPRNNATVYQDTRLPTYAERDQYMVGLADMVMCIWNGDSKGTLDVFFHANKVGKQAWLASFMDWFGEEQLHLRASDKGGISTLQFATEAERREFFKSWKEAIIAQMQS